MEVSKALRERRSIRKFKQEKLNLTDLNEILDYARLAAYPANLQPLKFSIITDKDMLDKIFPHTKWAGYLPETGTPDKSERPTAYIAIWGDKALKQSFEVEAGAAVTSMMLGAYEKGIASCWLGALDRNELLKLFNISADKFDLLYLLALGYPAQKSDISKVGEDGDIKYFELANGQISVPKRSIEDITIVIK